MAASSRTAARLRKEFLERRRWAGNRDPAMSSGSTCRWIDFSLSERYPSLVAKRRILIVDDNPNTRRVVEDVLKLEGYEVEIAADGVEALKKVGWQPPELIVLDLDMPRFDGFGVLQVLRLNEQTKAIPILILTAESGPDVEQKVRGMGADEFVQKGRDFNILVTRVKKMFEKIPPPGDKPAP